MVVPSPKWLEIQLIFIFLVNKMLQIVRTFLILLKRVFKSLRFLNENNLIAFFSELLEKMLALQHDIILKCPVTTTTILLALSKFSKRLILNELSISDTLVRQKKINSQKSVNGFKKYKWYLPSPKWLEIQLIFHIPC